MSTTMSIGMNPLDEKICEQLCAYMDGELAADEARFLERRLANEPALREKWQRLQLASACMKGQPFLPMSAQLCTRVTADLLAPEAHAGRPWRLWATAASIALLAIVFVPRMFQQNSNNFGTGPSLSMAAMPASARSTPSPSSADFVATTVATTLVSSAPPRAAIHEPVAESRSTTLATPSVASVDAQDIVTTSDSPADFPLVDSGVTKSWPRAELPGTANDPSIEAYLVRHNQMLASDGLGGFVPYVDVVTNSGDKQ